MQVSDKLPGMRAGPGRSIQPTPTSVQRPTFHGLQVRGSFTEFSARSPLLKTLYVVGRAHRGARFDRHPQRRALPAPPLERLLRRWQPANHDLHDDSLRQDGDDLVAEGDLTIKGVTRPVVLNVEFNGSGQTRGRHPARSLRTR